MNKNTRDGRGWTALAMERYLTMVYRLAHAQQELMGLGEPVCLLRR